MDGSRGVPHDVNRVCPKELHRETASHDSDFAQPPPDGAVAEYRLTAAFEGMLGSVVRLESAAMFEMTREYRGLVKTALQSVQNLDDLQHCDFAVKRSIDLSRTCCQLAALDHKIEQSRPAQ